MSVALAVLLSIVAHNPSPVPPPVKIDAIGKVREVKSGEGGAPQAVLELADVGEMVLHGLDDKGDAELMRLAGVRVRIYGVKGDPTLPRGNHVRVDRYEIVDVGNGVVPRIGRIAAIELHGTTRIVFVDDQGQADLLPAGFTKKMQANVGARAWMIGSKDKGDFIPTRFSILREKD